ncbi:GIY-YIG nuclease family protein [Cyanobium sp. NIES-981]|uniref:GIY-YIG nuclease family protein n=1 Tax=Cyanobium sp. NIES-981 TaxID=1851505 RepID=UPI0007DCDA3E|nr:GIY-YIG nuclease family protein [Cyanobium sp. NIES-981]SBO44470.1 conserved protein of unknown function [Cyanobium sp. NIES-981]
MARQGDLFPASAMVAGGPPGAALPLQQHQLQTWRLQIAAFQAGLLDEAAPAVAQPSLFGAESAPALPDPMRLQPQSLQFWRWPEPPQRGAALYFVTDTSPDLPGPLLLYVGETGQAGRRWKGDHDCKSYLAAYGEALTKAGLSSCLSIRFDLDVPGAIRPRRALEQALIRHWQPPFNKETRSRWATPFTAGANP